MIKFINFIVILIVTNLIFISCSVEKRCFKNRSDWNHNIHTLLDTSQVYIKVHIDGERDPNDLFLKQTEEFIKKNKPGIIFYSNGKFSYFTETISSDYTKRAIHGLYRVYNDTIQICRQYNSPQSGTWNGSSILIVNKKGFTIRNADLVTYYEKL